jgi:tight adherence protein B
LILKLYDYFTRRKSINKKLFAFFFFSSVILLCFLVFRNIFFSIFLGICLFIIFLEVARSINEKRLEVLHYQLIDFLINMIVMIRAGRTIRNIIRDSTRWTKNPLKSYLKHLSNQLELNIFFDEALDDFETRCSSREAVLIATALKLNNKIGGDIVSILGNIVETLQQSLRLKTSARTVTLQSRYSGTIIALLPIIILVSLFFFLNDVVTGFFASRIGNILLIIGGSLEITGILVIRKILAVNG